MRTAVAPGNLPPPMRLENLKVQHALTGKLHVNQRIYEGDFTLITLSTQDQALLAVFFRFAKVLSHQLPLQPTASRSLQNSKGLWNYFNTCATHVLKYTRALAQLR